jgi:hypothetical protein
MTTRFIGLRLRLALDHWREPRSIFLDTGFDDGDQVVERPGEPLVQNRLSRQILGTSRHCLHFSTAGPREPLEIRDRIEIAFERWGHFVCRHRWLVIALMALMTLSLASGTAHIAHETSRELPRDRDDPERASYDAFRGQYANDTLPLAVHETLLSPGRALVITSIALCSGFFVQMLGTMISVQNVDPPKRPNRTGSASVETMRTAV